MGTGFSTKSISTLGIILLFMAPSPESGRSIVKGEGDFYHVTIKIGGMTCEGCTSRVHRALDPLLGVVTVDVDLKGGWARVDFDPKRTTLAQMHEAIERTGYTVED